jgi:tRNA(Ile)-lysidine synthase
VIEDHLPLFPPGPFLVGFSGGADSTCLLDLLHEAGFDVCACHLNHGMLPEADANEEACRAFCDQRGIPFLSGKADVPALKVATGMGWEEAGRWARRAFFGQARTALGASVVALAHTLDDQAETVLMNMARGASMRGMGGMQTYREGIFRPLLGFSKAEVQEWCLSRGLSWYEDPTNQDTTLVRSRLRYKVMPELAAINPQAIHAIGRAAALIQEEDRFLNGMAAGALEQAELPINGQLKFLTEDCEASFDLLRMTALPKVLLTRALRLAAEAVGGSLDHRQTTTIIESLASQGTGSVTTEEAKVTITWTKDKIHFTQGQPTEPFRTLVTLPGETDSLEFGWTLTARHESADWQPGPGEQAILARIDAAKVQGQLFLRSAQTGDKMAPLGMTGSKLVSDIYNEMKLTQAAKARLPVICDFVGPLWLPNGPISERVKLTSDTERLIILTFAPLRAQSQS